MFDLSEELPGPRLSRALRITLEGGAREELYLQSFPDARDDEIMSMFELCDTICQSAGDLGVAIADRRLRQKDFEPRMTQQYPFLSDEDVTLLYDAAMLAVK
jgi:hypothetical protein